MKAPLRVQGEDRRHIPVEKFEAVGEGGFILSTKLNPPRKFATFAECTYQRTRYNTRTCRGGGDTLRIISSISSIVSQQSAGFSWACRICQRPNKFYLPKSCFLDLGLDHPSRRLAVVLHQLCGDDRRADVLKKIHTHTHTREGKTKGVN